MSLHQLFSIKNKNIVFHIIIKKSYKNDKQLFKNILSTYFKYKPNLKRLQDLVTA